MPRRHLCLDQLLQRFHSTDLALAAYNAGPTAVAEADGANVTALWRDLRGCC